MKYTKMIRRLMTMLAAASAVVSIAAVLGYLERAEPAPGELAGAFAAGAVGAVLTIVLAYFWLAPFSIRAFARVEHEASTRMRALGESVDSLRTASRIVRDGTKSQAEAIDEHSVALEELSTIVRNNANSARNAETQAEAAARLIDKGVQSVARLDAAMKTIRVASGQTAQVVESIDEIAFQTNLLALNAAVEAARAGDAGRGFAVVADEVRRLAQRSAEAARNTAKLIEESISSADDGVGAAEKSRAELQEIARVSSEVAEFITQIAISTEQQAQGIAQIKETVSRIDRGGQRTAKVANTSSATIATLNADIEELGTLIRGQPRLNTAPVPGVDDVTGGTTVPHVLPPPPLTTEMETNGELNSEAENELYEHVIPFGDDADTPEIS